MFGKVLVANRGEIAVRVIRTCRRLGIRTVAVCSDPDRRGLHVRMADEVVRLGGTTSLESYLDIDKVIDAARRSGAEAIHPGYGFLSENPDFAQRVAEAGLVFVGPPAQAIRLMGDKVAAKKLAAQAKVPVVPGREEPVLDDDEARRAAEQVGYPVLLKPAAGGGGKGMRIVREPDRLGEALAACRAEAHRAFGDPRVFVERFVERPRHVEVQIIADHHGKVVALGERECSIQRRYQKVLEEAPSPAVTPELRRRMFEVACRLAKAADYRNAGTVEMILAPDESFYFLEMNTRLQVEHPVTEMTAGLDLVELQLRVAAGEPLPFGQDEVRSRGWAIEARVCAEDPERGFLPSVGTIVRYEEPRGEGIRVDSGFDAGGSVTVHYDSLLAKVIAHGATREEARQRLADALDGYLIDGPTTNLDFLSAVIHHPAFAAGELSTDFLDRHFPGGRLEGPPDPSFVEQIVIAAVLVYHNRHNLVVQSLKPMAPRIGGVRHVPEETPYVVKAGDDVFPVCLRPLTGADRWRVRVGERDHDVVTPKFEFYRRRLRLEIDGRRERFRLEYEGNFIRASHRGVRRTCEIYTPREWELVRFMPEPVSAEDADVLLCPMPGLVVEVLVRPGERVYAGQPLVTLESMKMQSGVAAPRDAVIAEVCVEAGQAVDPGDVLMRFESA